MKIKWILAGGLVTMLAVPGAASQIAVKTAMLAPLMATPAGASTGGLFNDPSSDPALSIQLPTHFEALAIGKHPLQSFRT